MKKRLNKRVAEAAVYQGDGRSAWYLWDREAAGFALRIYPSGRKAFVVTYRFRGVQRFHTLGHFGEMTVDEARKAAYACRARARRGEDPAAFRHTEGEAPTVADLAERYMKEHAAVKKKSSSAQLDRQSWDNHILPRFGQRKVKDIDRADIAKLHAEMASTPVQANRVRSLISASFRLAEIWGWRPERSNPCLGIERYKEKPRERYLSEAPTRVRPVPRYPDDIR